MGAVVEIDLSKPSYNAAYKLARAVVIGGDLAGGKKLFARLMWLVPANDGGFVGLDDFDFEHRLATFVRMGLCTRAAVMEAMWAPGDWPYPPALVAAA